MSGLDKRAGEDCASILLFFLLCISFSILLRYLICMSLRSVWRTLVEEKKVSNGGSEKERR